jgi:hypothetical protein
VLYDMATTADAASAAPAIGAPVPAVPGALPAKPDAGNGFVKGSSGVGLRGIDASASASTPAAP